MDRGINEDNNKLESTIKVKKMSKYPIYFPNIDNFLASEVIDLEEIDDLSDKAYEQLVKKIEERKQKKAALQKR